MGMPPDPAELMGSGKSTDNGIVLDHDVSGQGGIVRKNRVVSDLAIMGHVAVGQKEIIIPDRGLFIFPGATIDGNEFAELVAVADSAEGRLPFVFQVLGLIADDGIGVKQIFPADTCWPDEGDMIAEDISASQFDIISDDTVGADFHVLRDVGFLRDDRCRVDGHDQSSYDRLLNGKGQFTF
jgi:hypothetical protein